MSSNLAKVWYHKSPLQASNQLPLCRSWGRFVRYMEMGIDAFATRQVDEYENGYLTCYDRDHWVDQFGSLGDSRYGTKWIEHSGEPEVIDEETFEAKWQAALRSEPFSIRSTYVEEPPPWIALYESGKWKGQT